MSLVVQKFGGSVLRGEEDVRRAAREVACTVARGHEVVVAVSALRNVTEALLARSRAFSATTSSTTTDLLLATGEIESAAMLGLALVAAGVPTETLNPWQIGVHTDDVPGAARIVRVDPEPLRARLSRARAVVVPGFLGRTSDERLTTLGRGGSDLTAIALADALAAIRCEFFKDVPGWFSADPALIADAVHRPEVGIEEALELSRSGCRFLQDRALEWAARSPCEVLIRAFDDARATRIARTSPAGAGILAITHAEEDDGAHTLIAIVGSAGALRDPSLGNAIEAALANAGIPARATVASRHRLAVRVPRDRASTSQQIIHDGFVAAPVRADR